MKVLISADIEGVAGVLDWDEATIGRPGYEEARAEMEAEVTAACRGAAAAGATRILVKDAHATGRNLRHERLPAGVELVRGWAGEPLSMVQGLDRETRAVVMVGYHARAGAAGNPLAHTMSSARVAEMRWNGVPASEFVLHRWAAAACGVPVVFVAGDEALCAEVRDVAPAVRTVATKRGVGLSVVTRHPAEVRAEIERGVREALAGDRAACLPEAPARHRLEIRFKTPARAHRAAFYPGAERTAEDSVAFESAQVEELLTFLMFVV